MESIAEGDRAATREAEGIQRSQGGIDSTLRGFAQDT